MTIIRFTLFIFALSLGIPPSYASGSSLLGNATVELAFPPEQDANGMIVNALRSATQQIRVQAFSFTSNEIAFALIAAQRRGVEVQIIADAEQAQKLDNSKLGLMHRAGIKIWLDTQHQSAHNKIIIIDEDSAGVAVVTGSMNFTYSGQFKNAENVVILRGNKQLAAAYAANWQRHRNHATPFSL